MGNPFSRRESPFPTPDAAALLAVGDVARLAGISPRSVWRYVHAGVLPPPVRLGQRLARWRQADVTDALARLPQAV